MPEPILLSLLDLRLSSSSENLRVLEMSIVDCAANFCIYIVGTLARADAAPCSALLVDPYAWLALCMTSVGSSSYVAVTNSWSSVTRSGIS
jgi:hypothetical protein